MITAYLRRVRFRRESPWNGHRSDHRPAIRLVLVRLQHHRRKLELVLVARVHFAQTFHILLPTRDILVAHFRKFPPKRLLRYIDRRCRTRSKPERQRIAPRATQLCRLKDVSLLRAIVFPRQLVVQQQIRVPVALSRKAATRLRKSRRTRERAGHVFFLRHQRPVLPKSRVAVTAVLQRRIGQHVQLIPRGRREHDLNQHRIPLRIARIRFLNFEFSTRIAARLPVKQRIAIHSLQ